MSEIRKVIQQGKTLTVSLPREWSEAQNLAKGSYISMSPSKGKGTALIIKKLHEAIE